MNIELIIENAQLKGRVIALDAEVKCLEAVIRAHERVDCLSVTSLKKQLVEADAENARLKAEVERLEKEVWRMKVFKGIDEDTTATLKDALNTVPEWAKVLETEAENARLKAEVERLRKLGTEMGKHLPDTDEANRAYIDFEAGGQS
jgi:cell division protein FtsB